MTGTPDRGPRLTIPEDVYPPLDAGADAMDVNTTTFVAAVLRGAVRTGQVSRLATEGLKGLNVRRRTRARLAWEAITDVPGAKGQKSAPARWVFETWTLTRRGGPTYGASARHPAPGDGWYLTGPGCDPACYLGLTRDGAQEEAEGIIRRWKAEEPVLPDGTEGQDRESYTDTQDRSSYVIDGSEPCDAGLDHNDRAMLITENDP